ncbi:MAG: type IV toxin-antitoxin system AbiEi family antitoxin domain-containing protein [Actinomycetota bacterium]|nr:type IV toxin-antitoxin system AbiEi family antitoxin domain-containing protein [Actinomycetota bacterium]
MRQIDAFDRPTDVVIAELAGRQHGRVATWQLAPLGVTLGELRRRVAAGRLHREFRGVYAVGHPGRSPDAWRMATVLACGPRAVLCHRSLAQHLRLLPGDDLALVHVTAAGRARAGQPGIRLHLPRELTRGEVTVVRGVPCTTVERLIADMAADAADGDLATVVHRAQVRRLIREGPMERQLARATKGIGRARALVEPTGPDLREAFEKRFHAFVRCGRWLAYEPNVLLETPLGRARFDALWRGAGFAIELDSWRHHGDRDAFESDRERVIAADLIGIDLKRVTWRMLTGTPRVLEALLDHRVGAPA